MPTDKDEAYKVKGEQANLFYKNGLTLITANLIALCLYFYLVEAWKHPLDQLWGILLGAVLIVQTLIIFRVRKISVRNLRHWRYAFLPGVLLLGILWASALLHLSMAGTATVNLVLTVSLIGAVFLLTTLLLTVDSFFTLSFLLASATFLIANPGGHEIPHPELFWTSFTGYYLSLLVLAAWMIATQQKFLLMAAHRSLLHERAVQFETESTELRNRLTLENDQRHNVERELYLAKEAAESANLTKTEFLATMSHEIRTPLNGILPILEMLQETGLNDEQQEYVTTALNSSQVLLSIINDILDFSKIEAGKLDLEIIEIDLDDMIEQVTSLMRNAASRKALTLTYQIDSDVPHAVRGDPIRLRQILTNLVSNAIKFTARGEVSVEVSHRRSSRTEVELLFAVRDTGAGLSEDEIAHLFEPFTQADASTTRKHGGTGLGLVICKRLTELMGGRIGVKSQIGQGSYFWFLVPLRKSLLEVPSSRRDLRGIRSLILGDETDPRIQQLLRQLGQWGIGCELASNQYDALAKLKSTAKLGASWRHELIIIDGMDQASNLLQIIYGIGQLPAMSKVEILVLDAPQQLSEQLIEKEIPICSSSMPHQELERILKRRFDVEQISVASDYNGDPAMSRLSDSGNKREHGGWGVNDEPAVNLDRPAARHTSLMGRVLVVEDNPVNQAVVKKILEKSGLIPVTANDGVEALEMIEREHFDVVLMDIQMPRMDGYQATKEIRQRELNNGLTHLPVIAMTANAMSGDRERCLAAGMNDYLAKPIKPASLERMLRQWLPMQEVIEGYKQDHDDDDADLRASDVTQDETRDMTMQETIYSADNALDNKVLEELYEIMDQEFVSILESFLTSTPSLMRNIKRAVEDNDLEALIRPAHSLKSSSANVGAMQLSALAKELEFKGRQGEDSGLRELYKRTLETFQRSISALDEIIARGSIH